MKNKIEHWCSRFPHLYVNLLRLAGSQNHEKIFYLSQVKRGDCVFELGANRGYFTKLFSSVVGSGGSVHAFEATPPTFKTLQKNCSDIPRDNLHLNNVAVGNTNGTVEINLPASIDGQASLKVHDSETWDKNEIQVFDAEMILLDDYVSENNITSLDFIKCDIEGAELLALQGCEKSLKKWHPKLMIEVYAPLLKSFNYTPADLFHFLQSAGYRKFYLVQEKSLQIDVNKHEWHSEENVYCTD